MISLRGRSIFFLLLIVYLVLLGLPSVLPVQSDVQKLDNMAANDAQAANATVAGIFGNNLLIAVFSIIPMFGFGWLALVIWQTGLVAASYPSVGLLVYLNPFVWVELPVYVLMTYFSLRIFQALSVKDKQGAIGLFKRGLLYSVVILLISAFVEILIIKVVSV